MTTFIEGLLTCHTLGGDLAEVDDFQTSNTLVNMLYVYLNYKNLISFINHHAFFFMFRITLMVCSVSGHLFGLSLRNIGRQYH